MAVSGICQTRHASASKSRMPSYHPRVPHDVPERADHGRRPCAANKAVLVSRGAVADLLCPGQRFPSLLFACLLHIHFFLPEVVPSSRSNELCGVFWKVADCSPVLFFIIQACVFCVDNKRRDGDEDDAESFQGGRKMAVVLNAAIQEVREREGNTKTARETLRASDDRRTHLRILLFLRDNLQCQKCCQSPARYSLRFRLVPSSLVQMQAYMRERRQVRAWVMRCQCGVGHPRVVHLYSVRYKSTCPSGRDDVVLQLPARPETSVLA